MTISYLEPLESGWKRMKTTLFGPFDVMKWIVLGFAVWLAELVDGAAWDKGADLNISDKSPMFRGAESVAEVVRSLGENAFWLPLIGFFILFALVVYGILLWVSSRAKFVYLDDVVRNEAHITRPWSAYGELADSLFKWRLVFFLLFFLLVSALVIPVVLATGIDAVIGLRGVFTLPAVLTLAVMILFIIVPAAYVGLFLNDFVVPIMYRDGIPATAAWGKFLILLREHLAHFLLYGLVILVLHILLAMAIGLLALFTCCMGALILAIPFVGTVLLLPIWVTYRVYSLEFLGQFDPRYRFFEAPGPETPAGIGDAG